MMGTFLNLCHWTKPSAPYALTAAGLLVGYAGWNLHRETPPARSAEASSLPASRRSSDCAAAALYVVCRMGGKKTSLDELRARTHTTVLGTDMLNLANAAREMGLKVEPCLCPYRRLLDHVSRPGQFAILHFPTEHFTAVVAAAPGEAVRVVDASLGITEVTNDQLARDFRWDGTALLITVPQAEGGTE